jgi:hypothetical protein
MTVATTQGVLNGLDPKKTLRRWQASRRADPELARSRPPVSRVANERALAQLAAAFPDRVKVAGRTN